MHPVAAIMHYHLQMISGSYPRTALINRQQYIYTRNNKTKKHLLIILFTDFVSK